MYRDTAEWATDFDHRSTHVPIIQELPTDVLEAVYYKNAARRYPPVKEVLEGLGDKPQ